MEACKAFLPELIQSRIDDLVNVQDIDGELAAHMKELEARMAALEGLAREEAGEDARVLVEDMERLIDRIRRDYVAIAYRQGIVDGAELKKLMAGPGEAAAP